MLLETYMKVCYGLLIVGTLFCPTDFSRFSINSGLEDWFCRPVPPVPCFFQFLRKRLFCPETDDKRRPAIWLFLPVRIFVKRIPCAVLSLDADA